VPQASAPQNYPARDRRREVNPASTLCAHCKCSPTQANFIFFNQGPELNGWYCFECFKHHNEHKALPTNPHRGPRAVPQKV
jgi:hypothetical protein